MLGKATLRVSRVNEAKLFILQSPFILYKCPLLLLYRAHDTDWRLLPHPKRKEHTSAPVDELIALPGRFVLEPLYERNVGHLVLAEYPRDFVLRSPDIHPHPVPHKPIRGDTLKLGIYALAKAH